MAGKSVILMLACALAMPAAATAAVPKKPTVAAKKAPAAKAPAKAPPPTAPLPDTPEVAQLRAAYAFALPVYEMMRTRHLQIEKAESVGAPGVNRLYARTTLADATSREVTTPNNDTLYSSAWLDLAGGPVILDTPAIADRYHSAALMDLFTDNVAIVGTRSGGTGGRYLIAGPTWKGDVPAGMTLLRSTTNDAWLLVRVLVNGPDDLAAATGLIRSFTIDVPPGNLAPVPTKVVPTPVPDTAMLIAVVDEALSRSTLPPAIAARAVHPELGISATAIDPTAVPAETMALWKTSLPALRAEIKGGMASVGTVTDGWSYPGPGIGNFGNDDAGRARVALGGLGALPPTEAMYLTSVSDKDGATLSGAKAYTVHIPGKLPVGGFWSLTMYRQEADGRLFFIDTPTKRFAVSDRTAALRPERDGGYDIFIQVRKPTGERVLNWLPAPAGPFKLVFRAYLPRAEFLDGSFRLPPVEATQQIP